MRCSFYDRPMSFAEREVGCPADHCVAGHHVKGDGPCPECKAEGRCEGCGMKKHPGPNCEENFGAMEDWLEADRKMGDSTP